MGLFGSLLKTAIHVATSPIDVVNDIATMGGEFSEDGQSSVVKKARKIRQDLTDIESSLDDL